MYSKINRKRTVRYTGIDTADWKVISFQGAEMSRYETKLVSQDPKQYAKVLVRRWNGFKTANEAAKALGGVAVRA